MAQNSRGPQGGLQVGRGGLTHFPFSHVLGGRQVELQVFSAASTINLRETLTPLPVMVSDRSMTAAVLARKKEKVRLCGAALMTWMLETPLLLMLICDGCTRERSKKPFEVTVSVDMTPALTEVGETLIGA
jgi:hypothetical protein